MDYWVNNPPIHLMMKAYLGIKPKSKPTIPDENELKNMVQLFRK